MVVFRFSAAVACFAPGAPVSFASVPVPVRGRFAARLSPLLSVSSSAGVASRGRRAAGFAPVSVARVRARPSSVLLVVSSSGGFSPFPGVALACSAARALGFRACWRRLPGGRVARFAVRLSLFPEVS